MEKNIFCSIYFYFYRKITNDNNVRIIEIKSIFFYSIHRLGPDASITSILKKKKVIENYLINMIYIFLNLNRLISFFFSAIGLLW